MKANPEIEAWLAARKSPAQESIRRIRDVILAEPRMAELVKYQTLQFVYEGDFANFVQKDAKQVTLMFNRGARIPGSFPHLEGTHPSARFMRFADLAEVEARAAELREVAAAWCRLADPATAATKPARKTR